MVKIANVKTARMWYCKKMKKDKNRKEGLLIGILQRNKERWLRFEFDLNIMYYDRFK